MCKSWHPLTSLGLLHVYEDGAYKWTSTCIKKVSLVPEPWCSPWPPGNHLPWHACSVVPLYRCREGKQPYPALLFRERGPTGHRHWHHQDRCPADPWHRDWHEGFNLLHFSLRVLSLVTGTVLQVQFFLALTIFLYCKLRKVRKIASWVILSLPKKNFDQDPDITYTV